MPKIGGALTLVCGMRRHSREVGLAGDGEWSRLPQPETDRLYDRDHARVRAAGAKVSRQRGAHLAVA